MTLIAWLHEPFERTPYRPTPTGMTALPTMLVVLVLLGMLIAVLHRSRMAWQRKFPLGAWWGDDSWRFIGVMPEPTPWAMVAMDITWGFVLTQIALVLTLGSQRTASISLAGLVLGLLVGLGWHRAFEWVRDRRRQLQQRPFAVRPGEIRLPSGTVVPMERVRSIRLGNTAKSAPSAPRQRDAIHIVSWRWLGDVSHTLEIDFDGKTAIAAGGMTLSRAAALVTEVTTLARRHQ